MEELMQKHDREELAGQKDVKGRKEGEANRFPIHLMKDINATVSHRQICGFYVVNQE